MTNNNFSIGKTGQTLKKLSPQTRNKVRAIVFSDEDEGIKLFNKLRKSSTSKELVDVSNAINALSEKKSILPENFPKSPQTKENYRRLSKIDLKKQLSVLNYIVGNEFEKLKKSFEYFSKLNEQIINLNYKEADISIGNISDQFGYSHMLLRKAVLMYSIVPEETTLVNTDYIIELSGLSKNNHIVSSLVHCYQEDQDLLSIKRSIMSTKDLGEWNRYTRDILRIAFHPHAKDDDDLSEMIQSNLQSSLIDAVIMAVANQTIFDSKSYKYLNLLIEIINEQSQNLDEIVNIYTNSKQPEDLFYQQSSAWLENNNIIRYRILPDHFYDAPEANYFEMDDTLLNKIGVIVNVNKLDDLANETNLTNLESNNLKSIQHSGTITRSSIFNYLVHITQGKTSISENNLILLMSLTSGLNRTINAGYLKYLAINSDSDISKIILYLLIAKKSKNESDDYSLRRLLQNEVLENHNGNLVDFISDMAKKSPTISKYAYEVCTEDFIARLSHLIKSSLEITETRASLHKWMGEFTGDPHYFDKGRNLIIDHKINLVKDELDDHRIYVDTARFMEWMENEVEQELSSLLLILEHNNELVTNEPQLISIVERCYSAFCEHKFFGIASYLGRRIRHGTFKGHLYSDVIYGIEGKYDFLLTEPSVSTKWEQWKVGYETRINSIVRDKLHIKNKQKNDGFLTVNIKNGQQKEIVTACIKNIFSEFKENRQTYSVLTVITEYCWRIAEVDLKSINSYLKSQSPLLLNSEQINIIKNSIMVDNPAIANDFSRDLQRSISEKLATMYGWFKRPHSVSPKASLGLLYKAVVAEVNTTYKNFNPDTSIDDSQDIEIMGGAYHVIYDALYVMVFNAAKHGSNNGKINRIIEIVKSDNKTFIEITISSHTDQTDNEVNARLDAKSADDIDNAQLYEGESGISKLYNLQKFDKNFFIKDIKCENGIVTLRISYELVYG